MKKYFFTLILLLRTLSAEVIVPVDAVGGPIFEHWMKMGTRLALVSLSIR